MTKAKPNPWHTTCRFAAKYVNDQRYPIGAKCGWCAQYFERKNGIHELVTDCVNHAKARHHSLAGVALLDHWRIET